MRAGDHVPSPLRSSRSAAETRLLRDAGRSDRGDRDDVFSHGFICPKGSTLKQLHEDPNRLRTPLVRRDGELVAATWDEAFAEIERRLTPIIETHGRDAVAVYLGNPNAHSLAGMLYGKALIKAIGSRNVYTASTVDQRPKELSAALMFGGGLIVPGSRHRPHRLPVDARRQPVRLERQPGDGAGLAGAHRGAARPRRQARRRRPAAQPHGRGGRRVDRRAPGHRRRSCSPRWSACCSTRGSSISATSPPYVEGLERLGPALAAFGPDEVADVTGVDAATIRRLARELAAAPRAAVYGRIGTTTAEFGTVASWLVDVLNICTGNLDRPGGAMFTTPAVAGTNTHGAPRVGRGVRPNHPRSRVRDLARHVRRAARRVPRRGDRDAGDGADQGVRVRRRQPGAVAAQRRAPRRRPRRRSS